MNTIIKYATGNHLLSRLALWVMILFAITPIRTEALSFQGTIRVKPGETFTVNAPYKSYTQSCAWLWGGEVTPDSEIYGTTNTVTFRATRTTPTTMPCKVQCTTYYHKSGSTSTGLNKEIVFWNVFVEAPSPTSISVTPESVTLMEGTGRQATVEFYPSGSSDAVEWSSGDYSVASVSSDGYISARSPGNTVVYARTNGGLTARCDVTVRSNDPTSISLTSETTVIVGSQVTLRPSLYPSSATTSYSWSSDNTDVATVDGYGCVRGISVGQATVTVRTRNDLTARCRVTVKSDKPESLSISPDRLSLLPDETSTLRAILYPSGTRASLQWESSDEKVATVNQSGLVKALTKGKAYITVKTDNGLQARCEVSVVSLPDAVSIPSEITVKKGYGVKVTPHLTPADAKCSYSWTSENLKVATVGDGFILGVTTGVTMVKCTTSNGLTATSHVTVTEPAPGEDAEAVKARFTKANTLMSKMKSRINK